MLSKDARLITPKVHSISTIDSHIPYQSGQTIIILLSVCGNALFKW